MQLAQGILYQVIGCYFAAIGLSFMKLSDMVSWHLNTAQF